MLTSLNRVSCTIRDVVWSGWGIRRLITLCGTVRQLVKENDCRLLDSSDSDSNDEDLKVPQPPQDPEELARRLVSFNYYQSHFHVPQTM